MKTMILSIVTSFVIASPVDAAPITWFFSGTTTGAPSSPSEFNGVPFANGLSFQFRILLDTDPAVVKTTSNFGGLEIAFTRQDGFDFAGAVEIAGQVLPVNVPVSFVEYFAPCVEGADPNCLKRGVTGLEFQVNNDPFSFGKQGPMFAGPLTFLIPPYADTRLGPIGLSNPTPGFNDTLRIGGPNLHILGEVAKFGAATSEAAIPEGGSTLLFLASGLLALGFLRRRYKRSAS